MTAKEYIKEQIPTMVGDNYVSNMKLTTLIGLLNGYSTHQAQERYDKALAYYSETHLVGETGRLQKAFEIAAELTK